MNATTPIEPRYAISVEVGNLDEVERDFLNTIIAVLTVRALGLQRQALRSGKLAIYIDGDEVTWFSPEEGV